MRCAARSAVDFAIEVATVLGLLLYAIARVGVGTDSIDLAAATEAGVVVMTTPGANRETAADHAVAMILAEPPSQRRRNALILFAGFLLYERRTPVLAHDLRAQDDVARLDLPNHASPLRGATHPGRNGQRGKRPAGDVAHAPSYAYRGS